MIAARVMLAHCGALPRELGRLLKMPVDREMDEPAMPAKQLPGPEQPEAESPLAQRMMLLGRLASSLSHALRNPLNAIFLHLDIVEEEIPHPDTARQGSTQINRSLAIVRGEIVRLHDLMQDYLALARLADLTRAPEDVRMLLEAVAHEAGAALTTQGILLRLEGLEGLGEMAVHRPTLYRAFLNVIQHAASTMPQGGCLTLRSSRTTSSLQVVIQHDDTYVWAQAGQQPLSEVPTRTSEELYLKLSAVQEIIAAHGGSCEVSDASAEGRVYRVTLPLSGGDNLE